MTSGSEWKALAYRLIVCATALAKFKYRHLHNSPSFVYPVATAATTTRRLVLRVFCSFTLLFSWKLCRKSSDDGVVYSYTKFLGRGGGGLSPLSFPGIFSLSKLRVHSKHIHTERYSIRFSSNFQHIENNSFTVIHTYVIITFLSLSPSAV